MTQGIFVRECPKCKRLKHTHDQTGKSQCAKCEAKHPTPAAVHVVETLPPEDDDEPIAAPLRSALVSLEAPAESTINESFAMPGFEVSGGPTVSAPSSDESPSEDSGRSKKKR